MNRKPVSRALGTFGLACVCVLGLAFGAQGSKSRFGATLEAGVEPVRSPAAVVLLHGLGRSARNMLILKWRLEARGYHVCNVGYDTRVSTIDHAIEEVHRSIRACRPMDSRVDFVTHSLGGLVLRGLLDRHPMDGLGRAVMLAPPNSGSEIADRLRRLMPLGKVLGPLSVQLGTRPEDLPQRLPAPSIPFGVIAGDQWINPVGPLWLPAPHDGTVSVASTKLQGMRDHIVLPYTHTFIMNAAPVAEQVDTFLRRGRFQERASKAAFRESK